MIKRYSYYDENDFEQNDEMLNAAYQCNKFSRRNDISLFNMADYQSCENCRHMTADNQCTHNLQEHFNSFE